MGSVCSRVSSESALDVKPITTTEPRVLVKAEPELQQSTVRHLTHAEAMEEQQAVTVTTTVRVAQKPKRPSSLLVGNGSNSLSSLNIPIETPTNVMNQLDFNALLREPAKDEPEHGAAGAWKSEHRRTFGISVMCSDQRLCWHQAVN